MGGVGPASLSDFAMEVQFWERLGLRAKDVDELPWKQAVEYATYIELICKREQQLRESNASPGNPQPRM